MFLPPAAPGGLGPGLGGAIARDEAGLPLDWKTTRLRSTSNASGSSGDTSEGAGDEAGSSSGSVYDKAATKASEEILQMLRASLKATSPFKFMTDLSLSQLQGQGLDGSGGGSSSEKTQEVLLQERRKGLKPTGSLRRESMRLLAGDDATDLHSVISEQTMESYHGSSSINHHQHQQHQQFNDGEVAVANPVEWLEAKKKNLRPATLRLQPPSHHSTTTTATAIEEALDDQRSVGRSSSTSMSMPHYPQCVTLMMRPSRSEADAAVSFIRKLLIHPPTHPPLILYTI